MASWASRGDAIASKQVELLHASSYPMIAIRPPQAASFIPASNTGILFAQSTTFTRFNSTKQKHFAQCTVDVYQNEVDPLFVPHLLGLCSAESG